jgi:hypothetical protein
MFQKFVADNQKIIKRILITLFVAGMFMTAITLLGGYFSFGAAMSVLGASKTPPPLFVEVILQIYIFLIPVQLYLLSFGAVSAYLYVFLFPEDEESRGVLLWWATMLVLLFFYSLHSALF